MADVFTKAERSRIMSKIRSKNTKPEVILAKLLKKSKIKGFKTQYNIEGKPDIAFPKQKIAIFLDGCFWHCCPIHCKKPKSNKAYWLPKLRGNVNRGKVIVKHLRTQGWKVIRVWEHELRHRAKTVAKIKKKLKQ